MKQEKEIGQLKEITRCRMRNKKDSGIENKKSMNLKLNDERKKIGWSKRGE